MNERGTQMTTIYTIGYEGAGIEEFISTLQDARIEVLADVRAVALSRKKGFSKSALREHLEAAGIRYEHFVGLGDPKAGRIAAREGRLGLFRKIYAEHLKHPEAKKTLNRLATTATNSKTCLLCFEREPKTCHRSIVAERLGVKTTIDLFISDLQRNDGKHQIFEGSRPGQGASAA